MGYQSWRFVGKHFNFYDTPQGYQTGPGCNLAGIAPTSFLCPSRRPYFVKEIVQISRFLLHLELWVLQASWLQSLIKGGLEPSKRIIWQILFLIGLFNFWPKLNPVLPYYTQHCHPPIYKQPHTKNGPLPTTASLSTTQQLAISPYQHEHHKTGWGTFPMHARPISQPQSP